MRSLVSKVFRKSIKDAEPERDDRFSLEKTFLSPHYQNHNIKRLAHLNSLKFNFDGKKVIEFGAGVGDHTYYYLIQKANILPTEARHNLVDFISTRFGIDVVKIDLEKDLDRLKELGMFDFAHCYGVLYHIRNPEMALEAISNISQTLLLETAVSPDSSNYGPNVLQEDLKSPTQSLSGLGCRPNRRWLYDRLKEHFNYVYSPVSVPDHVEFPANWDSVGDATLTSKSIVRSIFIASHEVISNEHLTAAYLTKFG